MVVVVVVVVACVCVCVGGGGFLVFAAVARMYISSSLLDLEINIIFQ